MSSNKLLENPKALCNMVRRIALEAGAITLHYFDMGSELEVETKDDSSPVTLADQEAEKFIEKALYDILPDVPIIGEEAASAGKLPDLKAGEYFWLVDPLDGTKEFINGSDDFTVNIALIKNHEPVMGVVYAPALGELYAGYGAGTAIHWREDTDKEKTISVRPLLGRGLTIVASLRHGSGEKLDGFLEGFKVEKMVKRGSSLKICVVAEGKADMYPRFGPTCEWDTAAGDAVLRSAGGFMTDEQGTALRYGGADPKFLNPEFIASSFEWFGVE